MFLRRNWIKWSDCAKSHSSGLIKFSVINVGFLLLSFFLFFFQAQNARNSFCLCSFYSHSLLLHHSFSLSLSLTLTHTLLCSHKCTHTHTHTHANIPTHTALSLTHIHKLSHTTLSLSFSKICSIPAQSGWQETTFADFGSDDFWSTDNRDTLSSFG